MDIKHEAEPISHFVCERELWIGNGEDTPMQLVETSYSVHSTYHKADLEGCLWLKRGWKVRLFQEEQ